MRNKVNPLQDTKITKRELPVRPSGILTATAAVHRKNIDYINPTGFCYSTR
jgi:hypothetical protein